MTICCWTRERKETRGAVFKKQQFITVCYSTSVRIEMKKEGQFSKKSNWWQYATELVCVNETRGAVFKKQQFITVCYSTCVRIEMKQEGQFSTKKTQIYYSMLFNLCAYWNETRGVVFKKIQLMTICCWTRERKETRGAVFKKTTIYYPNCVRIDNRGSFQKNPNDDYAADWAEMKQEGQFSKNNNLLQYAIQLVCVLKWNKRGSFQFSTKKTRGAVFKKNTNLLQYAIQLVCVLKWNKRDSF